MNDSSSPKSSSKLPRNGVVTKSHIALLLPLECTVCLISTNGLDLALGDHPDRQVRGGRAIDAARTPALAVVRRIDPPRLTGSVAAGRAKRSDRRCADIPRLT